MLDVQIFEKLENENWILKTSSLTAESKSDKHISKRDKAPTFILIQISLSQTNNTAQDSSRLVNNFDNA
jgi:hypothetical protein